MGIFVSVTMILTILEKQDVHFDVGLNGMLYTVISATALADDN